MSDSSNLTTIKVTRETADFINKIIGIYQLRNEKKSQGDIVTEAVYEYFGEEVRATEEAIKNIKRDQS